MGTVLDTTTTHGRLGGTRVTTPGAWPELMDRYRSIIPRYPGPDVVPPVRRPAPPVLDESMEMDDRVKRVALAYAGAVRTRYGACGAISPVKRRKALEEGADWLTEFAIPPAAWMLFSMDTWRSHFAPQKLKHRPPPVRWACSSKRIVERRDWYKDAHEDYKGGQTSMGPDLRALLERWTEMQGTLLAMDHRRLDAAAVSAVVRHYFKPGAYEWAVGSAMQSAMREQALITRAAQRGEWVW